MTTNMTDTRARTWRDWLARFQAETSTKGYIDFLGAWENADIHVPALRAAPLYVLVTLMRLATTYLLAAVQAAPEEAEHALGQIQQASRSLHFDPSPPKEVGWDRNMKEMYRVVTQQAAIDLRNSGALFFDIFMHYIHGDIDPAQDVDTAFREACMLSLRGEDALSTQRIASASALVLVRGDMWRGWQSEGSETFRDNARMLYAAFENFGKRLPLLPIDAQRHKADDIVQTFPWPAEQPLTAVTSGQSQKMPFDAPTPEEFQRVTKMLAVSKEDAPWTDRLIRSSAAEREHTIEIARSVLFSLSPIPLPKSLDGQVKSDAMRALGVVRYDDVETMERIIELIVECHNEGEEVPPDDAEEFDAEYEYQTEVASGGVQALQMIGAPAVPILLRFLRNSLHTSARIDIARALGVAGRGLPEVFDYLLGEFENTTAEDGKAGWAMPLALTHDERAILPLARGLAATRDAEDDLIREDAAYEYMDALDELDAVQEIILPEQSKEETEAYTVWVPVIVRGVGLFNNIAPMDWLPPSDRALQEAEWQNDYDEDEDDYDDVVDDEDGDTEDDDEDGEAGGATPFSSSTGHPSRQSEPMRPVVNTNKVGRNDPCPCGSGKKYKYCHGKAQ